MTLSNLLDRAGVAVKASSGPDPEILGTVLDSRQAGPGVLFFAIRGLELDGEHFAPQAIERGASAVVSASPAPDGLDSGVAWVRVDDPRSAAGLLSREYYGRPDEAVTLIGVTGTNGKTTVTYLIEAIVAAAGRRAAHIGTTGYATPTGSSIDLSMPSHTTPEAPDFYRLLAAMRDASIEIVAAEISSHALALSRVEGASFRVGAFLNLSRDHLDFHGDENEYFEAKARLLSGLGPEACAVMPAESEFTQVLRKRTRAQILTFGFEESADMRLVDEHCSLRGSSAVLVTPRGKLPVRTHLLGRFNLLNVAAAAACAWGVGVPAEAISAGVLATDRVPGRLERVDCGQPFAVLVDFAHTDAALNSLLSSLRPLAEGALTVVFGCGGNRDRGKRAAMGRIAAEHADHIFITSDNPRDEDPQEILAAVAAGAKSISGAAERCRTIVDRREAIRAALIDAGENDIVVLAGKGHETTVTIGDRIEPFDDREVARQELQSLGFGQGNRADA